MLTDSPATDSSVPPAEPERLSDEGKDVCVFQDDLGGGLACAVPTARVHSDHQRLELRGAAADTVLQRRAVLQGVEGHHAIVVIGCQQQNGRVAGAGVRRQRQIMERRIPEERWEGGNLSTNSHERACFARFYVLDEPSILLGVVGAAVVGGPSVTDGEFVELEHIHHADLRHRAAEQIRTLVDARGCASI